MINNMIKNVSLGKAFKMASDAEMDQRSEDKKENKSSTILTMANACCSICFFILWGGGALA